jgi:hypothetical protein
MESNGRLDFFARLPQLAWGIISIPGLMLRSVRIMTRTEFSAVGQLMYREGPATTERPGELPDEQS